MQRRRKVLEVKNVVKVYNTKGGVSVRALDNVSVRFPETGLVFLLGKSGSGKSTLLNVTGGLDKPDCGEVIVKGRSSKSFSSSDFDSYRNTFIGFVFQEYNILNEFTVEQNVALALQLQGKPNDKRAVAELLEQVDLKGYAKRKPNTLSGGQKQRVAIARALIKEPQIIMADEPTGALDSNTGKQVFDTLKKLSKTKLVIVVSHDRDFAETYADRIIELADGKIISDVSKTQSVPKALSDNVSIISEDTLTVKNAEKLTDEDVKRIAAFLKKTDGETIITSDKREMSDIKRACKISDTGAKEYFKDTGNIETGEYDGKATKFIKSRLPASHAIKIGASGLKVKPFRLMFTIFLAVVSFVMFGVVSTFMLYDENYSVTTSLQRADYDGLFIDKKYKEKYEYLKVNNETGEKEVLSCYENLNRAVFGRKEVEKLNDNSVGLDFAGVYTNGDKYYLDVNVDSGLADYYLVTSVFGFTDCGKEYLMRNGFNFIAGDYPIDVNEIAVPEYVYSLYKNETGSAVTNPADMMGKSISVKGLKNGDGTSAELKVTGVYKTFDVPYKYEVLKREEDFSDDPNERYKLKDALQDYLTRSFHTIICVSDKFYDEYKNNFNAYGAVDAFGYDMRGVIFGSQNLTDYEVSQNSYCSVYTEERVSTGYGWEFFDKDGNPVKYEQKEDEVFVPYGSEYGTWSYDERGFDKWVPYVSLNFKDYKGKSGTLTVKGYYVGNDFRLILSKAFVAKHEYKEAITWETVSSSAYVRPVDEAYQGVITASSKTRAQISFIAEAREGDVVYVFNNGVYTGVQRMISIIKELKTPFLVTGLVVGFFAALLLLNFITLSVSAKIKEIGILRAVGARGADVFKIFFAEALIIVAICFVLATVGSYVLCGYINVKLASSFINMKLLDFGPINVGLIFVISIFTALVAVSIPVGVASKKPPVDSIRAL